eukprot:13499460-Alexandrium_andersonii.AAC.1
MFSHHPTNTSKRATSLRTACTSFEGFRAVSRGSPYWATAPLVSPHPKSASGARACARSCRRLVLECRGGVGGRP